MNDLHLAKLATTLLLQCLYLVQAIQQSSTQHDLMLSKADKSYRLFSATNDKLPTLQNEFLLQNNSTGTKEGTDESSL